MSKFRDHLNAHRRTIVTAIVVLTLVACSGGSYLVGHRQGYDAGTVDGVTAAVAADAALADAMRGIVPPAVTIRPTPPPAPRAA